MSVCAQCAGRQKTCCERPDIQIALTPGDIQRLRDHCGHAEFFERKAVEPEFRSHYVNPENHSSNDALYVKHLFDEQGRRPVLLKQADLSCLFVTPTGCSLPHSIKPLLCRIYPFDWNDQLDLWLDSAYCPPELFASEADLIARISEGEAETRELIRLFYREIGLVLP